MSLNLPLLSSKVLHKKKRIAASEPPRAVAAPDEPVAVEDDEKPKDIVLPHLEISRNSRRAPVRKFADDWHSDVKLHWGLPNALLGYNETTKLRSDKAVEQQRRNVRLMKAFATVNETVSALLQLLQMETAAVLTQTPDRAHTKGTTFTMKNYVTLSMSLDEKLKSYSTHNHTTIYHFLCSHSVPAFALIIVLKNTLANYRARLTSSVIKALAL
jgi:hypothetical protein